jgi:hypothetical protein
MPQFLCKDPVHNRFSIGETLSTLLGCLVVVDKEGRRVDQDPNYYWNRYTCMTCGKDYTRIQKGWKVRFFVGDVNYPDFNDAPCFHEEDITPPHMRGHRG